MIKMTTNSQRESGQRSMLVIADRHSRWRIRTEYRSLRKHHRCSPQGARRIIVGMLIIDAQYVVAKAIPV